MGAWIETHNNASKYQQYYVAPYVGAWIETPADNCEIIDEPVAPYVGAWIETTATGGRCFDVRSRTLRGCVD